MDPKNSVFFLEPSQAHSFQLKGIRIEELLPRALCKQFSAYIVDMQPHQIKKPSYHIKGEELYYVISGSGKAELGNQSYQLKQGCFFRVPPGMVHTFVTEEENLCILNFHSPPVFSDQDTYFI